jgi:hypothetical protein
MDIQQALKRHMTLSATISREGEMAIDQSSNLWLE